MAQGNRNKIDFDNDLRFSIVTVAEKCGIGIVKTIDQNRVLADCPFCGSKGHLYLTLHNDKGYNNVYKCMKCQEKGSQIVLYSKIKGVDTHRAFLELAGESQESQNVKRAKKIIQETQKCNPTLDPREIEYLDKVYREFLDMLQLSRQHYENLLQRGLNKDSIKKGLYKSINLPYRERTAICRTLMKKYNLKGVPGFFVDSYNNWNFVSCEGFLIPIKDIHGFIISLQIRRDTPIKKRRYIYFSSTKFLNSTKAIAGIHFVKGTNNQDVAYITEGPLKADIANYFTGYSFFAVPGVNVNQDLLIECLKECNYKRVIIAFDMDIYNKVEVKKAIISLIKKLDKAHISYRQMIWTEEYKKFDIKGIDDLYLYRKNQQQR